MSLVRLFVEYNLFQVLARDMQINDFKQLPSDKRDEALHRLLRRHERCYLTRFLSVRVDTSRYLRSKR